MKPLILILISTLFLFACETKLSDNADASRMQTTEMAPSMDEGLSGGGRNPDEVKITEKKIIRNGNMTIKVDDAVKSKSEIDAFLLKHKAYTGNEHFDNTDYSAVYQIQIRVPAENLDALVKDIESIDGLVTNKSVNASDVSEEYIDLETRLANKRAYLDQYRSLLKNARTITDILKMQEQIRALEEEIESVEGRLRYLKNQVALSTLDITLMQQKDYVYRADRRVNFLERLKDSISDGWFGFMELLLMILAIWPFWLCLIIIIWLFKRYSRRRKNTSQPPSA